MELRDFYAALLPPQGHYALFRPAGQTHTWTTTLDELVAKTEALIDVPNVYFATGSYLEGQRTQASCTGKKCFYLDIDAGEAKFAKNPATAHRTLEDAKTALSAFIEQFGLAPSIVVLSGGGLHVYWVLDEVLSGQLWSAAALRFKRATKGTGLKADPTCTADSARILRPVGTLHGNGERVQALNLNWVYSALSFNAAVDKLLGVPEAAPEFNLDAFTPTYDIDFNDEVKPSFDPIPTSALKITEHCPAMAECRDTKGNVVEPEWRAMIGILKHCVDGKDVLHAWSEGHPAYDSYNTNQKFAKYEAGPTTCETFGQYTDKCLTCSHLDKIKSPISLGRITEQEKADDPVLAEKAEAATPEPLDDDRFGHYKVEMQGAKRTLLGPKKVMVEGAETVKWIAFTTDLFWISGWTLPGSKDKEGATVTISVERPGEDNNVFVVPMGLVADRKNLVQTLAEKSIVPINHEPATIAMMQQYVNDLIKKIRDSASRPIVRGHLGFHMDSKGTLWTAYGDLALYADGTIQRVTLDRSLDHLRNAIMLESLVDSTRGQWDASVWNEIFAGARRQSDFFKEWYGKRGMEVAQLGMMLQMASPLLMFTADEMLVGGQLPSIGLTVSLYSSGSGKGKTSIQLASAYAYGNAPNLLRQGDKHGMTFNAQVAMASSLGTFPFPMDEVTGNDALRAADSISRMASGVEKDRAGQTGLNEREPFRWALISTVSTNVPQRELVAAVQKGSDALQMRLIELNCDTLPTRTLDLAPKYDAALAVAMKGTKGSIGAVIHLYCMKMGYDRVRAQIAEKVAYVAKMYPGEMKERFLLKGFAAMLVLQDMLINMGLNFFEKEALESQIVSAFGGAREHSTTHANEPGYMFIDMMTQLSQRILITNLDLHDDGAAILENVQSLRDAPIGRLCRNTNALYITLASIKAWCAENGVSPMTMMTEARKANLIVDYKPGQSTGVVNLARGIRGHITPKQTVIKVSATGLRGFDTSDSTNVTPLHKGEQDERNLLGQKDSGRR